MHGEALHLIEEFAEATAAAASQALAQEPEHEGDDAAASSQACEPAPRAAAAEPAAATTAATPGTNEHCACVRPGLRYAQHAHTR